MDTTKAEKLKRFKVYEIWHKRKGHFIAKLINVLPTDPGDEKDKVFLHVVYDVRLGTDQYNMNTTGKQTQRESLLRPSLITEIKEFGGETWLRDVEIPTSPPKEKTLVEKAINKFFGGE